MKTIERGHVYELEHVDGSSSQRIFFVRRRDDRGELLPPELRSEGILSQELLRVLIDRTLYLYAEAPCNEDTEIIGALRRALSLYESRAARRVIEHLSKPEEAEICPGCGHILCNHPSID